MFVAFAIVGMFMASCDSNKGKIEEVTAQFIEAVAAKDKVVLNELYPESNKYSVLKLVDSIDSEKVSIEFNKEDSVYVAKLNDKQSLVFKVTGKDEVSIVDSYNILKLNANAYDLAANTSAPVTKQSDIENGKLFSDESDFMQYLITEYSGAANGYLYHDNGRYNWRGGSYCYVQFDLPVTNGGSSAVSGKDYSIEVIYAKRDTGERVGTSASDGVDLAPGETYVYTLYKNDLYTYANSVGVTADMRFIFKNASASAMLAKYGKFNGSEYENFVAQQKKHLGTDEAGASEEE